MKKLRRYAVTVDEERSSIATFIVFAHSPQEACEKAENDDYEDIEYRHEEDYRYDWSSAQAELKEERRYGVDTE